MISDREQPSSKFVDYTVVHALRLYLWYGLHPGHFGRCLIYGDYEAAMSCAYTLLQRYNGEDIVANMIEMASSLPSQVLGKNFETWKGFDAADPATQTYILLKKTNQWWAIKP